MPDSIDTPTTTNPPLVPALEKFLDDLIEAKKYSPNIAQAYKDQMKSDLRPLLMKAINLRFYATLSIDEQHEFDQLVQNNSDTETLQAYLEEHVDNQEYNMAKALINFRNQYLGNSS